MANIALRSAGSRREPQHVARVHLPADLAQIDILALVGGGGTPLDHDQGMEVRQRRADVFHDAVGQDIVLGVGTQILKRQDDDGGGLT